MLRLISLNILWIVSLSACRIHLPFLYQQDIAQGNVYPLALIQQLQPGMERAEVHRLLGTPQLSDPFRPQEDVYAYHYFSGYSKQSYQRGLNLYYENDRLQRIEQQPLTVK